MRQGGRSRTLTGFVWPSCALLLLLLMIDQAARSVQGQPRGNVPAEDITGKPKGDVMKTAKVPKLGAEERESLVLPSQYHCTACFAVMHQLTATFGALEAKKLGRRAKKYSEAARQRASRLSLVESLDALEDVCKSELYDEYQVGMLGGVNTLFGEGTLASMRGEHSEGFSHGGGRWPLRLADYCKQVLEGDDELIRQARRMAASVAAGEFTFKQPADSKSEEEEEEEPGAAYLYATYRLDAKLGSSAADFNAMQRLCLPRPACASVASALGGGLRGGLAAEAEAGAGASAKQASVAGRPGRGAEASQAAEADSLSGGAEGAAKKTEQRKRKEQREMKRERKRKKKKKKGASPGARRAMREAKAQQRTNFASEEKQAQEREATLLGDEFGSSRCENCFNLLQQISTMFGELEAKRNNRTLREYDVLDFLAEQGCGALDADVTKEFCNELVSEIGEQRLYDAHRSIVHGDVPKKRQPKQRMVSLGALCLEVELGRCENCKRCSKIFESRDGCNPKGFAPSAIAPGCSACRTACKHHCALLNSAKPQVGLPRSSDSEGHSGSDEL